MSSTHLSLHYHIVFGTKNHEPMILVAGVSPARPVIAAGTAAATETMELTPKAFGVERVSNHVHLLIGLRATHRLAEIRELKAVSSGVCTMRLGRVVSHGRRLRRFTMTLAAGSVSPIHQQQADAPSHAHVSRGVSGIVTSQRRRI